MLPYFPKELFAFRRTFLELLLDTGHAIGGGTTDTTTTNGTTPPTTTLRHDPRFPPSLTVEQFEAHWTSLTSSEDSPETTTTSWTDPLADRGEDMLDEGTVHQLQETFDWTQFLFAEQDMGCIVNRVDSCAEILGGLLKPWMDQVRASPRESHGQRQGQRQVGATQGQSQNPGAPSKYSRAAAPPPGPPPPPVLAPRNTLILFLRPERLLREHYDCLMGYLNARAVTDCVLISRLGTTPQIAKLLTQSTDDPQVRVMTAKPLLLHNVVRVCQDEPLYRRLNPLEVSAVEARYGEKTHFNKIWKSGAVCQYYGFRTGDVVLVQPMACKQFKTWRSVLEHLEHPEHCYVEKLEFRLVIGE